jgi:hypothetical protein
MRARRLEPVRLVRIYALVLGAGLLLDGGGLLLLDWLGLSTRLGTADTGVNLLHLVWGIVLLGSWVSARGRDATRVIWAALVFGAFYVALGVLGLTIDQPFGLTLGLGENIFHFTVGPVALLFGAWALQRTTRDQAAALPVRVAAPTRRRRPTAERKRPPRRGRSRRR